jgi:hypothetical protein
MDCKVRVVQHLIIPILYSVFNSTDAESRKLFDEEVFQTIYSEVVDLHIYSNSNSDSSNSLDRPSPLPQSQNMSLSPEGLSDEFLPSSSETLRTSNSQEQPTGLNLPDDLKIARLKVIKHSPFNAIYPYMNSSLILFPFSDRF